MMDWYYYIALAAIVTQLLFLFQTYKNYRFALVKYKKKRLWQELRVLLIVPCKGLDPAFQKNITSFFNQDYENYLLWFVVADEQDPAYSELCKLKDQISQTSKAKDVQILIAGKIDERQKCSQKIHNLLHCYERISDDVEVLAFADSDVCVRSDWLSHLIWPLRQYRYGAASGYRWFIPAKLNLASLALSAVNAKVVQLLGNTRFNQAWGGSMAIRVDIFRKVGLDKIWPKTLSDDLSLTYAVKKAGMKVTFIPACLVASYESATLGGLFEFGRRQFLITRISSPGTWLFGLFSSLYSVLGLWATAALAVYAAIIADKNLTLFAAVPIVFFAGQLIRAILRQDMAKKLLTYEIQDSNDKQQAMKAACTADILLFWLWSLLLLFFIISSAFGKTIRWRGIRYKLLGPLETITIGEKVSNGKGL
jgi:cellulose synthase/poly-beta-1,6-N-acetylglucosamine synthase-like glycosyltransferase